MLHGSDLLPPGIRVATFNRVRITFDPAKRVATLARRGLDFAEAADVFAGPLAIAADERRDYGERHFITAGHLRGRFVVIVWTPRGAARGDRLDATRGGPARDLYEVWT
jgi:uncharacterized DUF497 family protein